MLHPRFSGKGLLNKTWGANVQVLFVEASLPCTRISSGVWAPTHPWMAPEQASKGVWWLSVCILRFGSLRKAAAWQGSPAGFTKHPAELQNQQQCSARAGAQADVQHPEPLGSATQCLPLPLSHSPDPAPVPFAQNLFAQNDCLLSSACRQCLPSKEVVPKQVLSTL